MIKFDGFIKISSTLESNVFRLSNREGNPIGSLTITDMNLVDQIEADFKKHYVKAEMAPAPDVMGVYTIPITFNLDIRQ